MLEIIRNPHPFPKPGIRVLQKATHSVLWVIALDVTSAVLSGFPPTFNFDLTSFWIHAWFSPYFILLYYDVIYDWKCWNKKQIGEKEKMKKYKDNGMA
jgi:hypothetical protein